jgi:hypothetical protein
MKVGPPRRGGRFPEITFGKRYSWNQKDPVFCYLARIAFSSDSAPAGKRRQVELLQQHLRVFGVGRHARRGHLACVSNARHE